MSFFLATTHRRFRKWRRRCGIGPPKWALSGPSRWHPRHRSRRCRPNRQSLSPAKNTNRRAGTSSCRRSSRCGAGHRKPCEAAGSPPTSRRRRPLRAKVVQVIVTHRRPVMFRASPGQTQLRFPPRPPSRRLSKLPAAHLPYQGSLHRHLPLSSRRTMQPRPFWPRWGSRPSQSPHRPPLPRSPRQLLRLPQHRR